MEPALQRATVAPGATIGEAMAAIDRSGQGVALVVDGSGVLHGVVTDGDVRRALLAGRTLDDAIDDGIASGDFISVGPDTGRSEVLDLMRAHRVRNIPVVAADGTLAGLHGMHTILGSEQRPNVAVIMAGGEGTRLRPLTDETPKPMLPVAGRPILERLVLHLVGYGVRTIYLAVNYKSEIIEEHFGDGSAFGAEIHYLREDEPLGTAGPLRLLPERPAAPLLVMNGDLVTDFDVARMLDTHVAGDHVATVGLRPLPVEIPYGVAEIEDQQLVRIEEKPTLQLLVNAGVYVLEPSVLDALPDGPYPITAAIDDLLAEGASVHGHVLDGEWVDVGHPDDLRRARGEA